MVHKINDIEKIYPSWYDPNHDLSYDDQKWTWENTPLSEESERRTRDTQTNANVLNESVNGSSKLFVNNRQNSNKLEAISKLKTCTYKTPPKQIAYHLTSLFSDEDTKEGHWLFIAQHYNPRSINQVIRKITKQHQRGERTIKYPAKYFTFLIKKRKQRKEFRNNNACYKHQASASEDTS